MSFLLRSSSLVVLAYGAYLCIAHWGVLDGFQEAIRAAGASSRAATALTPPREVLPNSPGSALDSRQRA